jgi:hypothetical protein
MSVVVFVGPTLPPRLRPVHETLWDWRPPVRHGDLYRAALGRPRAIGVVDGYFEVVPTVWHKEVLWAMAQGIHVFGAASIGALRATELDVFGMRGVGKIYQDFRDGVLQDDDEIAVLHGPAELGYPLLTEAMVNMRATFAAAVREGVLEPGLAVELTDIAKAIFYKDRTYAAVSRITAERGCTGAARRRLADWLTAGRVDQKRRDAEAMLAVIRSNIDAGTGPLRVTYRLASTAAWEAARRHATSERIDPVPS